MSEQIVALVVFILAASFTPGPNNIMLMTSGVNFGFRRTLPHIAGVICGFPLMVALIGAGFGATITAFPWIHDLVSVLGILYMLWLAWHVARASYGNAPEPDIDHPDGLPRPVASTRPLSFLAAAAFQWVNIKGWVMAIGVMAVYMPEGMSYAAGLVVVVAIIFALGILSSSAWTIFGSIVSRWLRAPWRLKLFNWTMAALLVATLVPAIVELSQKYA